MNNKIYLCAGLLFLGLSAPAHAQLIAADDFYGVPYGKTLLVEFPGVLENDLFDGEPAEDAGATATLLLSTSFGTLSCDIDPNSELCSDGSFNYSPGPGFSGTDSFVYRASVAGESQQATVTLSACSGGPSIYVCWEEAPYLAKLAELGYGSFKEGFENNMAWGSVRWPIAAPLIISRGIKWESNHPAPPAGNQLTTGSGPARTGQWGLFDPEHGYATGTASLCDVDVPPPGCLYNDGFSGTREAGKTTLHGVGGYFTGSAQPKLAMILDGGLPITLGAISSGGHQFFGVINTAGFNSFRVEETDGKVGQARFVFADDFTFATGTVPPGAVDSTLRIEHSSTTPGNITLSWSPSCSGGAVDYAIFEGTIGIYYSHAALQCTDAGGDLVEDFAPPAGNSYYLVVPLNLTHEGSYGLDFTGAEIPAPPTNRCLPSQMFGGCG